MILKDKRASLFCLTVSEEEIFSMPLIPKTFFFVANGWENKLLA
jgi:hypothetical protein